MVYQGKTRKYIEEYLKYGFTSLSKGDFDVPQCVICLKTLSNDAMRPTRMKRHLTGTHPDIVDKPEAYFVTKRDSLMRQRLDGTGTFRQQSAKVVESSYELSLMTADAKKPHSIGETLVKPCILWLLPEESYQKLSKISLSDSTVKLRIDEMAEDIKTQVHRWSSSHVGITLRPRYQGEREESIGNIYTLLHTSPGFGSKDPTLATPGTS
ncbi:zinc finger BED domain-containing protein 5-like [Homarus americanus]|uniref:zinc finger BED domain-containing protein 5-like n=1 Tax=Homarus americanus TaxID=6706 RepID=UPI001C47B0B4|nr:zinc finger BED domain-containing protein 5-like [Homarus americanus]